MNLVALRLPQEVDTSTTTGSLEGIGPILGKLAKQKRKKQTDLAKSCGISRISINRFFRGKSEIRATDLTRLLTELGIDLEMLIRQQI